ncbi:hypothetical protein BCR34DRAFT_210804 [Clohesyomyces aquaticus]|uniref:Uncharacterized protein n=1 Tax=Clohesyomyces aquaticus TaxID=1231657 RepID=A0A1Y2ABD6_9PLEO|nr:hypothetical protein BCR34DRAFT_210804 [Clohesyomyces aquaticus]
METDTNNPQPRTQNSATATHTTASPKKAIPLSQSPFTPIPHLHSPLTPVSLPCAAALTAALNSAATLTPIHPLIPGARSETHSRRHSMQTLTSLHSLRSQIRSNSSAQVRPAVFPFEVQCRLTGRFRAQGRNSLASRNPEFELGVESWGAECGIWFLFYVS